MNVLLEQEHEGAAALAGSNIVFLYKLVPGETWHTSSEHVRSAAGALCLLHLLA